MDSPQTAGKVEGRPLLGEIPLRPPDQVPWMDADEVGRGDYAILELWSLPWDRMIATIPESEAIWDENLPVM